MSEEHHGQPQRASAKVSPSDDTERDDRHHRVARSAPIAPDSNGDAHSAMVGVDATADLALAQAVPDHLQAAAQRAAADAASGAAGRADALD
jgi:hypothetical protein